MSATTAAASTAGAPITVVGPSRGTRGTARRGGDRTKGKGCAAPAPVSAGGDGGDRGDGGDGGNSDDGPPGDDRSGDNLRPLCAYFVRPFFAACVKCVAEVALRPPVDKIPEIQCNWDCTNSVSCALCKGNGKSCF
ncbi:hypothetical protein N7509_007854 [Penicillium cosmopolitanum]|uniref:Uncharacterized protein n=1 Tax=Penicillium cosmopolitanum TaxID=1131564 RepID=A0A9W9VZQ1_9EURO|nr:uncharacterized protein N7509_007854 [Penicillium cosmopolitanum]KAJ5392364.1 hypothetical protein N7509_007854 [Penicillium cosmopolitanum]